MARNMIDHIVICNWNERGIKIVNELHSPLAVPDTEIIILSSPRPENEEWLRDNYSNEYSNVEIREGNPLKYEAIKRASAHKARTVIILSNSKSDDPDGEACLLAIALNKLWKNSLEDEVEKRAKTSTLSRNELLAAVQGEDGFKKPRIIAEVKEHSKMQHIRDGGADDVICAADYSIGIIAQSAINTKLADVYNDLLTYRENTSEIYIVDNPSVSSWANGKTFREISMFFIDNRCASNPAILIGLRKGKELMINPKDDIKSDCGDALIFLAYDIPDIMALISGSI